jgi:pimeloyl-ACP methyl ester carboxylesterase
MLTVAVAVAVAVAVVAGFLATATAASAADLRARPVLTGPAGAAFYTPPHHLPVGGHGTLIWSRPFSGSVAVKGAVNTLLLYEQVGIDGKLVATSGFLAVPKGPRPKGGWPIVSWAHGTTGIADSCAPTRNDSENDQITNGELLDRWLARGYAVVRTDYEGLGTPGPHPYLDGVSEGRAMLDAVTAAREFDARLSDRVVVAGHSQGGHATLWAAAIAPRYAPNLDLRGAVAFAPVSHLADNLSTGAGLGTPLIALMLRGMGIAYPDLNVSSLLTQRAAALYPQTLIRCAGGLQEMNSFGGLPRDQLFKPAADLAPLSAALTRNDPTGLQIGVPTMIEQGLADSTVLASYTEALARSLKAAGDRVTLRTYPGATHNTVIADASANATAFVRHWLGP